MSHMLILYLVCVFFNNIFVQRTGFLLALVHQVLVQMSHPLVVLLAPVEVILEDFFDSR